MSSGSCPLCLTPPCFDFQKPRHSAASFLASFQQFITIIPRLFTNLARRSTSPSIWRALCSLYPASNDTVSFWDGLAGAGHCMPRLEQQGVKEMSDSMSESDTGTVLFGDKLISSSGFKVLFREGMALVEET